MVVEYITMGLSAITLIAVVVNTVGLIRTLNSMKQSISNSYNPQFNPNLCTVCKKPIDSHTVAEAKKHKLIK